MAEFYNIIKSGFYFRLANPRDTTSLMTLFNSDTQIFGEAATGYGDKDILEYINDPKKKLFVCIMSDKIIGALMADYHETYAHLETLIVAKPFQKKGVGSKLFQHFEDDLEQSRIPLIEVLTDQNNVVMQKILDERGFRKGNTFIFYSKGE